MTAFHHCHDPHTLPTPYNRMSAPRVDLEITRGAAQQRLRTVEGPAFLIGTASDCDLVLGDGTLPSVHTCLLRSPQGITVRHLGFDPDLCVNDRIVDCVRLADGDRIQIGRFEFRLHIQGLPPAVDQGDSRSRSGVAVRRKRRSPDDGARAQIRDLLAEIRRLEASPATLRLFVGPDVAVPASRQARLA